MEKYANKDKLLPPSASVAKRSGAIVLYGERVPYIVCQTGKGNRLADWAVSPEEMRRDKLHIHHSYYIVKQVIPVLSRVFSMIGVDVSAWWSGSYVFTWSKASYPMIQGQQTMDQFMQPFLCPICCQSHGSRSCVNCDKLDSQFKLATLLLRCKEIEKNMLQCSMQVSCNYDTVSHAANTHFENSCESIHCPFYWKRTVYLIRDQKLYERWKKINF